MGIALVKVSIDETPGMRNIPESRKDQLALIVQGQKEAKEKMKLERWARMDWGGPAEAQW